MQLVHRNYFMKGYLKMNNNIRIVIVDDNEAVISSVKKYFWSNAVIDVVETLKDGREALDYLLDNQDSYDLVILDVLLPTVDGIRILQKLKQEQVDKKIIVLSSYKDDYTIRQAQTLNVDYYMLKPFDMDSLKERILDIAANNSLTKNVIEQNIEVEISTLLHDLGIPSHVRGYQYIREGIKIIYTNPGKITMITKEIYPELADKYDTTTSRVERAIRHAIEISWIRGDIKVMDALFGHSIDIEKSKPTNSEFMTTIADYLKINTRELIG